MSGMQLLLKSLGFDPEDLKKQAQETIANLQIVQKHYDDKLNIIIANQNKIAASLNIHLEDVINGIECPANPH